jgi:hypothetical protein
VGASGEYANEVWGLNAAIAHQVGHPMSLAETAHWLFDQGVRGRLRIPARSCASSRRSSATSGTTSSRPPTCSYHFARVFSPLLAFLPVRLGVLGPLGLLGAWWAGARRGAFLLGWILVALLTALLFYVSAEYRLPSRAALAVFAGFAVVEIVRALRKPRARLVEAVVALPLLALAFWTARPASRCRRACTASTRSSDALRAHGRLREGASVLRAVDRARAGLRARRGRASPRCSNARATRRARCEPRCGRGSSGQVADADMGDLPTPASRAAARFQAGISPARSNGSRGSNRRRGPAGDTSLASGCSTTRGCAGSARGSRGASRDFEQVIAERRARSRRTTTWDACARAQGRRAEAVAEYRKALELNPNEPGVRAELEALLATRP